MHEVNSLVKLLRKGDVGAFNKLFGHYSHRLYAFGLKYLKSPVDAEGLVQDVFFKIWRNRERLNEEENFQAYLFTIAYNQIKKYFQKKSLYLEECNLQAVEKSDDSAEESISYQSVLDQIAKLIEQLPPKKQKIFNMSRFEGKSSREIAGLLGISPKTVDNQVSEVIGFLKNHLKNLDSFVWLFFMLFLQP